MPDVDAETGKLTKPRLADRDVYPAHDVTRGTRNTWPSVFIYGPRGGVSYDGGPACFSIAWPASLCRIPEADKDKWREHIQVATDPDLEDLVIDKHLPEHRPYQHALPVGKYYWRIRVESDADATPWTPVVEFEILP